MVKPPVRTKSKPTVAKTLRGKDKNVAPQPPALVSFQYQDVAYQIDMARSKVYRKFIEIEKSKQYSIINAYRGTRPTA